MQYLNIFDYYDRRYPFQIFVGGRGTGKTFGALSGTIGKIDTHGIHMRDPIYMRRTGAELELLFDSPKGEGANPYKKLNSFYHVNYGIKEIKKNLGGIYHRVENEEGRFDHQGLPIGYATALSTLASIRSLDFSSSTDWFYDEFIPEAHVRKMKGECDALLNAYETINRNREFDGEEAVRLWMLSNSNDIYSPIFVGLGIVDTVEKMLQKRLQHKYIKERGLAIHILDSPQEFIDAKKQTALYKLTAGTKFSDMALENKFSYNDFSLVAYRNVTGYIPFAAIDDIYLYKKKGSREIYLTYTPSRVEHFFSDELHSLKRFQQKHSGLIYDRFVRQDTIFESFAIKEKILDIIL